MASLTIGWEYLTGYAVATDPSNREQAEWPPHPARVFMALAAAWFERGEDVGESEALRWLEDLDGDPELHLPPLDAVFERSPVTVYVPVNDKAGPAAATLQSASAITRSKRPRTFPRVWVGSKSCYVHWPDASGAKQHRDALDRLCRKVTRIGHSSSLVRMWVADGDDSEFGASETWIPDNAMADAQTRQTSAGMLDMLIDRYGEAPRQHHAELTEQIASLKAEKKTIKVRGARNRGAAIDDSLADLEQELDAVILRPPVRPTVGLWSGYRCMDDASVGSDVRHNNFDTDILVLTHVGGPQLPVVSTIGITRALRDTIMSHSGVQPVPAWVSGHEANGDPLCNENGHLAVIPLPFVGHEHADGHVLGMGLVFPRKIDRRDRGQVLGNVLLEDDGQPKQIELTLGRLGVWVVQKRHWSERRQALQPETWPAHPQGADTWASVTPVVLDRFPKQDRVKGRAEWSAEVAEIICEACGRIGLPRPVAVDIDTTSWHVGSPRALVKHRWLRGQGSEEPTRSAAIGDGFPPYPAKNSNASRPQVHVWLRFAEPVVGPILLGAGRYRGYGLLKPWRGGQ